MAIANPRTKPRPVKTTVFFSALVMTSGNMPMAISTRPKVSMSVGQSATTAMTAAMTMRMPYWIPREIFAFWRLLIFALGVAVATGMSVPVRSPSPVTWCDDMGVVLLMRWRW